MTIVHGDALAWLSDHPATPGASVVTSLPDRSELAGVSFDVWRAWFVSAARAILRWLPPDGVAVFYQTDVRHNEVWIDKSHLVLGAADAESAALVWHKIVCRSPPGASSRAGRPNYSHVLCLGRGRRAPRRPAADVIEDAGPSSWRRGMGVRACRMICEYLRDETPTRLVIDPCCGHGSVLAVAAAMGFDVAGVELNAKRCRTARAAVSRARAAAEAFARGAELFNRGEFFDAHEVWEERWRAIGEGDERLSLQGLIQVAAAFHKLFVMRAPDSAERLLSKGIAKLEAAAPTPGFDLTEFRDSLREVTPELLAGEFTPRRVPAIVLARRVR